MKKWQIALIVVAGLILIGALFSGGTDDKESQTVDSAEEEKTPDVELVSWECNNSEYVFLDDVYVKIKNNTNADIDWYDGKFTLYGVLEDGTLDELTVIDTLPANATTQVDAYTSSENITCADYKSLELRED